MAPSKKLMILLLIFAPLFGMEQELQKYLKVVQTCNPHLIRTQVPSETLKNNASDFFEPALICPNTGEIISAYDAVVTNGGPSWSSRFAHYYNSQTVNAKKKVPNHFLEKLIEHSRY